MDLTTFINQHLTAVDVAFFYLVTSSVVQALPAPEPGDGKGYRFIYRLAHGIVANWKPALRK